MQRLGFREDWGFGFEHKGIAEGVSETGCTTPRSIVLSYTRLLDKTPITIWTSATLDLLMGAERTESDGGVCTYCAQGAEAGSTVAVRPSFVPARKTSNLARPMSSTSKTNVRLY